MIFILMLSRKNIVLEGMSVDDAEAIFLQHGVMGASQMDKGELKSVYRTLALRNHPDNGGDTEDMQWLNAAYEVLRDAPITDLEPATFSPADAWYGRTIPKNKATKHQLEPIHVTFKNEYNDSVIAEGFYDFIDLVQMVKYIEKHSVEVSYDPLFPIDPKTGQWLTKDIVVYCNMMSLNPFQKQAALLMVKKLAKQHNATPKKSA